jgi:hypothetical protein
VSLKIGWVVVAENVTRRDDGLVDIVGGGLDHFVVASYPATQVFGLAVETHGISEPGRQYDITISVLDDQGETVGKPVVGGIIPSEQVGEPEGYEAGDITAVQLVAPFERSGVYRISAWIDGSNFTLPVVIRQPSDYENFEELARNLFAVSKDEIKPQ